MGRTTIGETDELCSGEKAFLETGKYLPAAAKLPGTAWAILLSRGIYLPAAPSAEASSEQQT